MSTKTTSLKYLAGAGTALAVLAFAAMPLLGQAELSAQVLTAGQKQWSGNGAVTMYGYSVPTTCNAVTGGTLETVDAQCSGSAYGHNGTLRVVKDGENNYSVVVHRDGQQIYSLTGPLQTSSSENGISFTGVIGGFTIGGTIGIVNDALSIQLNSPIAGSMNLGLIATGPEPTASSAPNNGGNEPFPVSSVSSSQNNGVPAGQSSSPQGISPQASSVSSANADPTSSAGQASSASSNANDRFSGQGIVTVGNVAYPTECTAELGNGAIYLACSSQNISGTAEIRQRQNGGFGITMSATLPGQAPLYGLEGDLTVTGDQSAIAVTGSIGGHPLSGTVQVTNGDTLTVIAKADQPMPVWAVMQVTIID